MAGSASTNHGQSYSNEGTSGLLDSDDDSIPHRIIVPELAPLRPRITKRRQREETVGDGETTTSQTKRLDIACPVCMNNLEEMKELNQSIMTSPCGHLVCSGCHDRMLGRSSGVNKMMACVTCRKRVKGTAFIKLFL